MKEFRFWLIFFSVIACVIWFVGRVTRDELPGRGVWEDRTFTNEEAGISLTVPQEYKIYTDAELIKMYDYPEDTYKHVKKETNYFDMQIGSGNSKLYAVYMVLDFNCSAEQYINITQANYTQMKLGNDRIEVSSEKFEKVLCGQTYHCLGMTFEGEKIGYRLWCFRYIPKKGWVYIQIEAENKETANEMLTFFSTETVRAGAFY